MTSDWLEVRLQMKGVLNFASTMPGVPSVMMDLMSMKQMSFVVSLAILIMVHSYCYAVGGTIWLVIFVGANFHCLLSSHESSTHRS